MTDGDETDDGTPEDDGVEETALSPDDLGSRLDDAETALSGAETEGDLDEVETTLDSIAADLDAADLPEPDEDDDDPRGELEDRLSELREELEDARGPYADEVVDAVESVQETIEGTRWTDDGVDALAAAVNAFRSTVGETVGTSFDEVAGEPGELADMLSPAAEAAADAGLDPDDDAETIAELIEAADDLDAAVEDAEEWDDLETRDKLREQGFYDVLGHTKDYPPEWAALKEHEKQGNVEMVVLGLESMQSEFMEENVLDALVRMNDPGAFEAMHGRAQRRDKPSIEVLGKMGPDAADAVETLLEYVDADSDPGLQKVTFRALGEIGDPRATGPLAGKLEMDNDEVRPLAARALGLIGDTRAIPRLADALSHDHDRTRGAAAWALRQIGTREALETVANHGADPAFVVETEIEKAEAALADDAAPTA